MCQIILVPLISIQLYASWNAKGKIVVNVTKAKKLCGYCYYEC